MFPAEGVPIHKLGHYGVYDADCDRVAVVARDKFQEGKTVLLEVLPQSCLLATVPQCFRAQHYLIRAMRLLAEKTEVTI